MSNLDRFKTDLEALINQAALLELALQIKALGENTVCKGIEADKIKDALKRVPNFNEAYEAWYSESLIVIKQLLPDRLQDFKDHFEVPKNRKDITFATYRIQDALKGLVVKQYGDIIADGRAAIPHFKQQSAILKAAERRFVSSLFDIRQLVQADLFDSELGSARELLKNKFLRAAGAIAGVILEKHLRVVCNNHNVKIVKKNPGITDMNELLKSSQAIDVPLWRFISMLADIRNICDHSKQKEPTE